MNTTPPKLRVLCFPKQGGNPYLNQLSSHLEAAGVQVDAFSYPRAFWYRYDVVHIQWPDTHLWSRSWWRSLGKHLRLGLLSVILRLRGTRLVWTLHNLRTHEKDHWIGAFLFPRWFPHMCAQVIALTPTGLEMMRQVHPVLRRKSSAVIPHGHYRDVFPPAPARDACRTTLGLPRTPFTFVYFGSIRGYKNVARLVEAFRRMPGDDVQLVVAGEPVVGMRAEDVEAAAAGDPRVHLHLRHIPDAEVPTFIGAADLMVTPFSAVLNSGSVMLALSLNRPVLAPRVGALPDLERAVGSRWLRLYDGPIDATVLAESRAAIARVDPAATVNLDAYAWPAIAAATIAHYTRPLEGKPGVVASPGADDVEAVRATPSATGS